MDSQEPSRTSLARSPERSFMATAKTPDQIRWCIVHGLPYSECQNFLPRIVDRSVTCCPTLIDRARLRSLAALPDEHPDA